MARRIGPESLDGLMLVSNPSVSANGETVLYVLTRISVSEDKYMSQILYVNPKTLEKRIVEEGPNDTCPQPSPDGRGYVFVRRREGAKPPKPPVELRYSTIDSPASRIVFESYGVRSISWSPDGRHLALIAVTGKPEEDVKTIETLPVWFNGQGYVYWAQTKPFIVDVESGVVEEIDLGMEWVQAVSIAWSPDGRMIAITVSESMEKPYLRSIIVYDVESGEKHVVAKGLSGYGEVAWSPDSSYIAYLGHRLERGLTSHNRVIVFSVDGGEEVCLTCSLDRNAMNNVNSDVRGPSCVRRIAWTRRHGILFHLADGGTVKLYSVDMDSNPKPLIAPKDMVVDEFSTSMDGNIIALTLMDQVRPKELYIYRDGRLVKATNHTAAWLSRHTLSKPERFVFKASDGVDIEGWILRPPPGVEEKGWILYIHGGPKTAWGYAFMHEFHVLAGNGYSVVYVNPRGSDGYSEEFADIRCRYGERDYQDLMEAYEYAVKELGLPADRAAVMGGSYGGFMVNWIIGHTDRFRSAVTMRSISNWISMYGTTDIGWYFVEDQICCNPLRNPDKCLEKSPITYAGNVKTPTLIIHSDQDYRCWLDQALQLYTILKLRGVKTRLAIFPGENHDLSRSGRPKHRVKRLETILRWLNETMK